MKRRKCKKGEWVLTQGIQMPGNPRGAVILLKHQTSTGWGEPAIRLPNSTTTYPVKCEVRDHLWQVIMAAEEYLEEEQNNE
jgi:hypothetical protein